MNSHKVASMLSQMSTSTLYPMILVARIVLQREASFAGPLLLFLVGLEIRART